ncbi:hypothetical protein [Yokenella regensburgei]|uniref:hypothetical protein n=1 Tax=Yokenella regensburgei TaxID=158877 RepID=UPI001432DB18|nr:hypothetical protein [Yokenella regensburgei]QIU92586.1 hypothetical protein HEC60_25070 [Yokenella regensburgei]
MIPPIKSSVMNSNLNEVKDVPFNMHEYACPIFYREGNAIDKKTPNENGFVNICDDGVSLFRAGLIIYEYKHSPINEDKIKSISDKEKNDIIDDINLNLSPYIKEAIKDALLFLELDNRTHPDIKHFVATVDLVDKIYSSLYKHDFSLKLDYLDEVFKSVPASHRNTLNNYIIGCVERNIQDICYKVYIVPGDLEHSHVNIFIPDNHLVASVKSGLTTTTSVMNKPPKFTLKEGNNVFDGNCGLNAVAIATNGQYDSIKNRAALVKVVNAIKAYDVGNLSPLEEIFTKFSYCKAYLKKRLLDGMDLIYDQLSVKERNHELKILEEIESFTDLFQKKDFFPSLLNLLKGTFGFEFSEHYESDRNWLTTGEIKALMLSKGFFCETEGSMAYIEDLSNNRACTVFKFTNLLEKEDIVFIANDANLDIAKKNVNSYNGSHWMCVESQNNGRLE